MKLILVMKPGQFTEQIEQNERTEAIYCPCDRTPKTAKKSYKSKTELNERSDKKQSGE